MKNPLQANKRRLKYGAMSTGLIAIFVVGILLLNLLVGLLGERVNLKIDMTGTKLYELSQDTKDYIKTLEKDVTIYICTNESSYDPTTVEIMKQYEMLSSKVHFEAIDVTLNPAFAQQYADESLTEASIIVKSEDSYKVMSLYDMYNFATSQTTGENTIQSLKAEQKLTSAIMYVTNGSLPIIYFTEGHNEAVPAQYQETCADNNLQVETISLLNGQIDERAEYLVIFAPQTDFSVEELRAIEDFADLGDKNILVYVDSTTPELPKLNEFLEEWGLSVQKAVILEEEEYLSYPNYVLPQYAGSDITEALQSAKIRMVAPGACPVNILFETKNSYTTFPILNTTADSYIKTGEIKEATDIPKAEDDISGPFSIAAGAYKSYSGTKLKTTNLMVFGAANIAADSMLQTSSIGNAQFVLNATLYGKEATDMISITPKYFDDTSLLITGGQAMAMQIIFIGVIPAIVLIAGIIVWIKRKNK